MSIIMKHLLPIFLLLALLFLPAALGKSQRESLINFYKEAGGTKWTSKDEWLTSVNECEWYGISCDGEGVVTGVDLERNQLTGTLQPLASLSALTYLSLSNNKLTGSLKSLSNLTSLSLVDLANNELTGTLHPLANHTSLKYFYSNDNQLAGTLQPVANLASLLYINLSNNQLAGTLEPLANLTSLVGIQLYNNRLAGTLDSLASLTSINIISLYTNQLTGTLEPLAGLTSLVEIYLDNNQLIESLEPLAGLTNLTIVRLNDNLLTGTLDAMASLTSLKYIYLDNNQLSGTLGPLAGLKALSIIALFSNRLTGTLEPLASLNSLEVIYLDNNELTGTLERLANLTSVADFSLFNNRLTGSVPPPLITLCNNPGQTCSFSPNRFMCGDQERLIGTSCLSCPKCADEGSGTCIEGFDAESSYLCASCAPSYFETAGMCTSCTSPASFSSWSFLLIAISFILVAAVVGFIFVEKNLVTIPDISLNLKNQIRVKQIAALFQMLALLVSLSLGYPVWLKSVTSFLDNIALPVTVNAPCIRGLENTPRWQRGLISYLGLCATICCLLFVRPVLARFRCVPPIRTKHFVNMQILASILVTQSAVALLPMTFNIDEMVSDALQITALSEDVVYSAVLHVAVSVISTISVVVGLSSSAVLLVDHAHSEYLSARLSFFENEEELSEEEQVDRLLPFWSTFCLSYVPRSANFESKVLRRRIMCFIFPSMCKLAALTVVFLDPLVSSVTDDFERALFETPASTPLHQPSPLGCSRRPAQQC
jgi:Leucine-rich repeat (LRR) protein